mmetsp:Transcript_10323/g.25960  ORF Transcript_10323/g.25960 Transcript_10323/m.25960 type:complete len:649 (+) Transcript_10323:3-1949(+)
MSSIPRLDMSTVSSRDPTSVFLSPRLEQAALSLHDQVLKQQFALLQPDHTGGVPLERVRVELAKLGLMTAAGSGSPMALALEVLRHLSGGKPYLLFDQYRALLLDDSLAIISGLPHAVLNAISHSLLGAASAASAPASTASCSTSSSSSSTSSSSSSSSSSLSPSMVDHAQVRRALRLLQRVFRGQLVVAHWHRFCSTIRLLLERTLATPLRARLAQFPPMLQRASIDALAISVCTVDGQRYNAGCASSPVPLQACSSVLAYLLACDQHGTDFVHSVVGHQPSDQPYDAVVLNNNQRPHNPFSNAGSIATCSLVRPEVSPARRVSTFTRALEELCGGTRVNFNRPLYLSEKEHGDANFSLAYHMRRNGVFPDPTQLESAVDFYFQINAFEASCDQLSIFAATLANGGVSPLNGNQVVAPELVNNTCKLLYSCGMNQLAGEWAFKVGLPAKSGASGLLLVIVPGLMGIAFYSPPLDAYGNSARGVEFCRLLTQTFQMNGLGPTSQPSLHFRSAATENAVAAAVLRESDVVPSALLMRPETAETLQTVIPSPVDQVEARRPGTARAVRSSGGGGGARSLDLPLLPVSARDTHDLDSSSHRSAARSNHRYARHQSSADLFSSSSSRTRTSSLSSRSRRERSHSQPPLPEFL